MGRLLTIGHTLQIGGFVVTWTNVEASDSDILYQVYDNAGTKVGTQKSVEAGGATDEDSNSKVVALADGRIAVAYSVSGGAGRDKIYSGNGDDILNGGYGNYKLFGEGGADVFVFAPNGGMTR